MPDYELKELTSHEGAALSKDLQEVLEKHGCEMGVTSTINLLKRVPKTEPTLSPIQPENGKGTNATEEDEAKA